MSITVNNRVNMLLDAIKENKKHSNRNAQAKEAAARERLEPLAKVPFEATTQEAIDVLNYELKFHTTGKKYARDEIRQILSILKIKLNTEKERAWEELCRKDRAELDAIGEKALNAKITLEQIADYKKSYEWNHTPAEAVGYDRATRTFKNTQSDAGTAVEVFKGFITKYRLDAQNFLRSQAADARVIEAIKKRKLELIDENEKKLLTYEKARDAKLAARHGAENFEAVKARGRVIEMSSTRQTGIRGFENARQMVNGGAL